MSQSPYQNGRRNKTYSSPTFQSTIFFTPLSINSQKINRIQQAPPYAINFDTTIKAQSIQSITPQPPPPYAINFDTKPDLDQKKKKSQKKHFERSQQHSLKESSNQQSNYFRRRTEDLNFSKSQFENSVCYQNSIQATQATLRTERDMDSSKPFQEQLLLESKHLEDFKEKMNKKIDSLNNTFNYEKRLLNKENFEVDVPPKKLTDQLRLLTQQYDEIDNKYDNDLKKIQKEKKVIYSKQLTSAIQTQREKQSGRKDKNQIKRQILEDLRKIEETKRHLVEDYTKLKKNYLNRSLHMQKNHLAQVSQKEDSLYLKRQVNDLQFVNRKKEEQNRQNIQLFTQMLKEPIRVVKPRSYDLNMYL